MQNFLRKNSDLGILFLRLGIGLGFILIHGWPKISGGPDFWVKLGGAMGNLGIHFAPVFWGFMSALSEFGGGILITLGLFTRAAAFFMAFNMMVAVSQHLKMLDPWNKIIFPIDLLAVFLCLVFIGAGKYSIDNFLFKKK
jgi:putative oxidoreductase